MCASLIHQWYEARAHGGDGSLGMVGGTSENGIANSLSLMLSSGGLAPMLVPDLLIPSNDAGSSYLTTFDRASLLEDDDGSKVIKIERDDSWLTLWIDPESFFILKAEIPLAGTITYEPTTGGRLSDADFVFTPPDSRY